MTVEHRSRGEEDTRRIAIALARDLRPGDVVALDGPLGAGKTAFVRGLAEGLGHEPSDVSSPTFIICQEYGEDDSALALVHIDAYRLERADDLATIGWDELLERDDVIIAVEWAERIEDALPAGAIRVSLAYDEMDDDGAIGRRILIERAGADARPCATCGKLVTSRDANFPFCSERCRMADLGAWFSGAYTFERPIEERDLDLE